MALFVCLRSGYRFYSKMVARFGIESMHEMRNSENNHRDFGIAGDKVRDVGFPLFKARNSGFKAKRWQDSGLKVCSGCGISKITVGITTLRENLGQDDRIEEPY